jgi:bifunctional DNA-binding transcriptional regulator/antitoxin component of YhaV-PrlF toxin-antitoxin module
MSEKTLLVGKRGEIYTDEGLRKKAGIRKGGRVKATVVGGRLIIEPLPSLEDLLGDPLMTISVKEAEALSEKAQKEEGVFG